MACARQRDAHPDKESARFPSRILPAYWKLTVDVIPSAIFLYETADFVEAMGPATDLVAGNEFDDGGVLAGPFASPYVKAEPLRFAGIVEIERRRARVRVPGGEQVVRQAQGVGAVA